MTKKAIENEIRRYERFAKKHNLEIISFCRSCGESWCTIEEWKAVRKCDNCKKVKDNFLRYAFEPEDVITKIKEMGNRSI